MTNITTMPVKTEITVVKRNNERTPLDISKIRKVVAWACEDLDVSLEAIESGMSTRLKDGVTTREIQQNLIECALSLCDLEYPDYRYVAGRLHAWNIWKEVELSRGYGYGDYCRHVTYMTSKNYYNSDVIDSYTLRELEEAGEWINSSLDSYYDYAGATLLSNRYLLKDELPQEMYLTIALLLAKDQKEYIRLSLARQYYNAMSSRKISLATPFLSNLRKPNGSLTSCFVIAMDDNLESIFRELTNAARISKNGGGVGCNVSRIRATGSTLMGTDNAAKGVIPWIKLLNDTMVAVDQAGNRTGAATVSLDIWHYDIPEFLEMQTEHGDQRRKAFDIFPQLVILDEFMRRAKAGLDWYLVDPYEIKENYNIDLAELWGTQFELAYLKIEYEIKQGNVKLFKKVNAKDLMKEIMQRHVMTGLPYLTFKDTINRANPNKYDGMIPSSNLCLAPETLVLTDNGHIPIIDLIGEKVNIWNGEEWSVVVPFKTGENKQLLKVNFSNGESLECTPEHEFHVQINYQGKTQKIKAKDLKENDKLIKYDLPLIYGDNILSYAYTQGFFAGDGSVGHGNLPEIDLYHEKRELLPYFDIRNKMRAGSNWRKELDEKAIYFDDKQSRIIIRLPLDVKERFYVPMSGYNIKSRLEWLAGLLDSDGTVVKNGINESLQIGSVNKQFLLNTRLMLQTLGIDSKVTLNRESGMCDLPDGKGGYKKYYCQESYRLLINSSNLFKLMNLGLETHRLKITQREPQRDATQFIYVTEIINTERVSDTYCLTEYKRHMAMFNGILTGQCVESYSNVKSGEYAHCCNLISLNLATIPRNDIGYYADLSVRMLDASINLTTPPFGDAKAHNDRYRTIGVGAMGLADYLAINKLKYDSEEARENVDELFEDIAYYCVKASMELAKEYGTFGAYELSEWNRGKLVNSKSLDEIVAMAKDKDRWITLADDIDKYGMLHSQLMAIAPNTSSSLVHGCTASILPAYSKFFYDKATGTVPIAPTYIKEAMWYYQENKTMWQSAVIKMTSTIQKWVDTGISMELIFNLNAGVYWADEPERKITAFEMFNVLMEAWEAGCKAVYYVRCVQLDTFKDECSTCAN